MAEASGAAPTVVVFDGVCVLCSGWVRFLLARDPHGVFRYAAMQGQAGRHLLQRAGIDPDDPVSFMVLQGDAIYTDSQALLVVLRTLGRPWAWVAATLDRVPRGWRDVAYRAVARRRYRWFGRREQCLVPGDAVRARFLP